MHLRREMILSSGLVSPGRGLSSPDDAWGRYRGSEALKNVCLYNACLHSLDLQMLSVEYGQAQWEGLRLSDS